MVVYKVLDGAGKYRRLGFDVEPQDMTGATKKSGPIRLRNQLTEKV
jgi:hypothetical protein